MTYHYVLSYNVILREHLVRERANITLAERLLAPPCLIMRMIAHEEEALVLLAVADHLDVLVAQVEARLAVASW